MTIRLPGTAGRRPRIWRWRIVAGAAIAALALRRRPMALCAASTTAPRPCSPRPSPCRARARSRRAAPPVGSVRRRRHRRADRRTSTRARPTATRGQRRAAGDRAPTTAAPAAHPPASGSRSTSAGLKLALKLLDDNDAGRRDARRLRPAQPHRHQDRRLADRDRRLRRRAVVDASPSSQEARRLAGPVADAPPLRAGAGPREAAAPTVIKALGGTQAGLRRRHAAPRPRLPRGRPQGRRRQR